MGWKSNIKSTFFQTNITFPSLFALYCLVWEKICSIFGMLLLLYSRYAFNFYQDYFWMLQYTHRFSSLNHQGYWKKKKYDLNVTLSSQVSSRN